MFTDCSFVGDHPELGRNNLCSMSQCNSRQQKVNIREYCCKVQGHTLCLFFCFWLGMGLGLRSWVGLSLGGLGLLLGLGLDLGFDLGLGLGLGCWLDLTLGLALGFELDLGLDLGSGRSLAP